MPESFIKVPTEILKNHEVSNLEFRVLTSLIFLSSFRNNHCFLGSEKLAEFCGIGRAACRNALKRLQEMHFITITNQSNCSRSNDISLSLDTGIQFLRDGGRVKHNEVALNDSPKGDLNDSGVDLNNPRVDLKEPPHIEIDLNINKYNLNNNEVDLKRPPKTDKKSKQNKIATSGVADVRSMPIQESAKGSLDGNLAAKDKQIAALWRICQEEHKEIANDLEIIRVGETYGIRKISKYALTNEINARQIAEWLTKNTDVVFNIVDTKTHYVGEIAIRG